LPTRVMVQTMDGLQGKVMNVCILIELQKQVLRERRYDVYWYYILRELLGFLIKTKETVRMKQEREVVLTRYDTIAVLGDEILRA